MAPFKLLGSGLSSGQKKAEAPGLSSPMKVISEEGEFDATGFKAFLDSVKLAASNYAVVAIVGPQSSGKSTLLNTLFSTSFREMNAETGRRQTTRGIWLQTAPKMEPLTVVLDMEGVDGKERGEDDKAFEKQSSLFALAVADIVLINMWCNDVGREHAGNRPLLKTIFEVMIREFGSHKTNLLFVIRDKTLKTPLEILESDLKKDVEKIWEAVPKPQGSEDTPLSKLFNVEVTCFSNYESAQKTFEVEAIQLRSKYFNPKYVRGLVGENQKSTFHSAKRIWDIIKESKDLDHPPLKVMVATVRCEEIAMDKLRLFKSDKDWLALQEMANIVLVPGFGARVSSILSGYLSQYDSESINFVQQDVRTTKRSYLSSEILKEVQPSHMKMLGYLREEASRMFEYEFEELLNSGGGFAESLRKCSSSCLLQFDQRCSDDAAITIEEANCWEDSSAVREELLRDIQNHSLLLRMDRFPQVIAQKQKRLSTRLRKRLRNIVKELKYNNIWEEIRSVLRMESDEAASALSAAVLPFEPSAAEVEKMVDQIRQFARKEVETTFQEETQDVLLLMKQRFLLATFDNWKQSDKQLDKIVEQNAYNQCLKLLSTVAVIRLDEMDDNVESVLISALMGTDSAVDPLASDSWEKVPPEMTLITPRRCKEIWNEFKQMMKDSIDDAIRVKEHCARNNNFKSFSTWAILGVIILGVGGLIFLLRTTNADVWLALTVAGITCTITVIDGICKYTNENSKRLRKKHRELLKKLKLSLIGINEMIMVVAQQRSYIRNHKILS